MSEGGQPSVGQTLRDAREAQGVTLDEAAVRLRLMHRQIEAMERDDFESLGQPVFARGFVRNYARLLGLAPDPLLARMSGAPVEPPAVSPVEPALPRSWLASPWLILVLLGLLLVVAVPVALYLWLNSEGGDGAVNPAPRVAQSHPAPAPAPVVAPVAATAPVPAPADAMPAAPVEPSAPAPSAAESVEGAGAPATSAPAAAGSVLHIEFGGESWTEIKDASGHVLHRQLNPADSSVDVRGQPPFDLVIGNAPQVRMTYNGRPIDLKPFIDGSVARFTLEESLP